MHYGLVDLHQKTTRIVTIHISIWKGSKNSYSFGIKCPDYVVNIEDIEQVSPLQRRYDQLMHLEEQ
jgi:hypothetical protein